MTLALKAEEAGKVLDAKEEEYVRLQFERNELLQLFPNSESREEHITKKAAEDKEPCEEVSQEQTNGWYFEAAL